jgi:hypothetical protein
MNASKLACNFKYLHLPLNVSLKNVIFEEVKSVWVWVVIRKKHEGMAWEVENFLLAWVRDCMHKVHISKEPSIQCGKYTLLPPMLNAQRH